MARAFCPSPCPCLCHDGSPDRGGEENATATFFCRAPKAILDAEKASGGAVTGAMGSGGEEMENGVLTVMETLRVCVRQIPDT